MNASENAPEIWTILLAAGSGQRFGGDKLFQPLGTSSVLERSLTTALRASQGVLLVLPLRLISSQKLGRSTASGQNTSGSPLLSERAPDKTAEELPEDAAEEASLHNRRLLAAMLERAEREEGREILAVPGGATRTASVRCGLAAAPATADVIVVHDAARPLASAALYAKVVAAVRAGADGAAPAVAVTDTIRHLRGGTLERSSLRAVQTPQAFDAAALRNAHAGSGEATDDTGLLEAAGGVVKLVEGDPANIKLTTTLDLAIAQALLRQAKSRGG